MERSFSFDARPMNSMKAEVTEGIGERSFPLLVVLLVHVELGSPSYHINRKTRENISYYFILLAINLHHRTQQESSTAAELFDIVWKENKYKGFSHETAGESQTPFLNTFIEQLSLGGACVVELGAGSCDHAVRMAMEECIIKQVTAVEFSETAVTSARQRLANFDAGVRSRLTIECNDLFTFVDKLKPNSIQGIYANSVLHFLTRKQRQDLYRQAYKALSAGGLVAVSFKTTGDALHKRGEPVEDTAAGVVIRDASDHICRLFVSPSGVNVLAAELRSAGFRVNSVLQWSVPDYNIEGDDGQFVGFVAAR